LLGSEIVDIKSFDGVKFIAKNGSWLMLRGSGTEPVLRIYAEAPSQSAVNELLKLGQNLAAQI
jgi:phosphomannomutase